jgi:hypothetical protein
MGETAQSSPGLVPVIHLRFKTAAGRGRLKAGCTISPFYIILRLRDFDLLCYLPTYVLTYTFYTIHSGINHTLCRTQKTTEYNKVKFQPTTPDPPFSSTYRPTAATCKAIIERRKLFGRFEFRICIGQKQTNRPDLLVIVIAQLARLTQTVSVMQQTEERAVCTVQMPSIAIQGV